MMRLLTTRMTDWVMMTLCDFSFLFFFLTLILSICNFGMDDYFSALPDILLRVSQCIHDFSLYTCTCIKTQDDKLLVTIMYSLCQQKE